MHGKNHHGESRISLAAALAPRVRRQSPLPRLDLTNSPNVPITLPDTARTCLGKLDNSHGLAAATTATAMKSVGALARS